LDKDAFMKRDIPRGLSIYLDLVRIGAAIVVVLSHVWSLAVPALPLPWPGHASVIVFFVLSGFVITHAARPGLGLRGYALHRIARIYPVAIGAILLSVAIVSVVPATGLHYVGSRGSDLLDMALNVAFLGQSWMDVPLPYDAPFWSLNYEVWYYVIFGIACYRPKRWWLLAALAVAGPKILLLMPVWLLGVLLYRRMPALDRGTAVALFCATLVAGLVFVDLDLGIRIREAMRLWCPRVIELARGSNQFAGDFLLGVIVALHFLAAWSLRLRLLLVFEKAIRYLSSVTFSMYLFHMPLTILIWNGLDVHSVPLFFGLLLAGILVLGEVTERRTGWYRARLEAWLAAGARRTPVGARPGPGQPFADPLHEPASLGADPHP
jgi:peptidoglycan/LPS O-acetylase OafA/YrhL